MKQKHLYIILAIVLIILVVIVIVAIRTHKKPAANSIKSILFIGDSNTAEPFSYADQLKAMYPNLNIKKLAKSSEKTDWMLSQLQNELQQNKYDAVSILGGSNDIYALDSIDSAKNNLNSMYVIAHNNGAKVLAVSPPNKNWYVNKTDHKQKILHELIDWINRNPNKDYFINFWDITNNQSFFSSADGYQHAQAPAHKILATETARTLNL